MMPCLKDGVILKWAKPIPMLNPGIRFDMLHNSN